MRFVPGQLTAKTPTSAYVATLLAQRIAARQQQTRDTISPEMTVQLDGGPIQQWGPDEVPITTTQGET